MSLRPYQIQALDEIRAMFRKGVKKVLLHMPTGGGKTTVYCTMIAEAAKKGSHALVVVRGRMLVQQASARLDREKVPHGVMQASHWRNLPHEKVQVCSIDTLARRKCVPKADIIIIDEAQDTGSESYHWLMSQYPDAYVVGVSATPHVKKGLRHIADEVVYPITVKELTDQGFLVPARYFIPSTPDFSAVSVRNGEYDARELAAELDKAAIYGDVIESYRTLGENRPALAFAINIKHSLHIVDAFNQAGIPAAHLEADTPQSERERILKQLEVGELKVVSNVGVLTVGVDLPFVSCLILARPTLSYNLSMQIIGRGTRPAPGKNDFIVLDHAGNVLEHGPHDEERVCNLDGFGKEGAKKKEMRRCDKCFFAWPPLHPKEPCPACNYLPPSAPPSEREEPKVNTEATLVEYKKSDDVRQKEKDIRYFVNICRRQGKKQGWVFYKLKDKYGEHYATRVWPYVQQLFRESESKERLS